LGPRAGLDAAILGYPVFFTVRGPPCMKLPIFFFTFGKCHLSNVNHTFNS